MAQLLFEIGVEELPALAIEPAMEYMASFMEQALAKAQLPYSGLKTFGTPRRLVLMIDNLALGQPDVEEEITGPNAASAYKSDGSLTPAALGFIKAKGLSESQIYRAITAKGEVLAARVTRKGLPTNELLPAIFLELMRTIPFKKRMRWDNSGDTFSRPVRWLLCLFDGNYLPLSFADVRSGSTSRGHRFMAPETFEVKSNEHYLDELAQRFVMLSPLERQRVFVAEAHKKLAPLHARFSEDAELLAIVRNLFEYPFVILGSFAKEYLAIPQEILICEMTSHQKCFAVYDAKGQILPYFICSAGVKPFDEEVFAKGNARVLRARFEDGAFYFAEDKKKTLAAHALALEGLVFERELGSVAQKAKRIEKTALELAHIIHLDKNSVTLIEKATPLLKADLVTGVVGQFPELQGTMGRIYANLEGQAAEVAEAIETHYLPRFAEDRLPRLKAVALLSIADKLDTLVGIIGIGKRPKGNKDPFGLRRSAIGIVRMLVHFAISVDLKKVIQAAISSYGDQFAAKREELCLDVEDFIIQRARGLLIEDLGKESTELAVSFADSILSVGASDLVDAFARGYTLYAMRNKNRDDFESLTQAFKRAGNIVKKAREAGENIALFETIASQLSQPSEKDLFDSVKKTKALINARQERPDGLEALRAGYADLFGQVALIRPKLDAFFDAVMVMVDDKKLREARLGLLSEIKAVADKIADFTHL